MAGAWGFGRVDISILLVRVGHAPGQVRLRRGYFTISVYLGLPVKLGKDGVKEIVKIELAEDVKAQLDNSANATKNNIDNLKEVK